jgi:hypothetical protein
LKENIGQLCPMKSVLNCSKPKYRYAKKYEKVETKNQWKEPTTNNDVSNGGGSLNDYQSKAQQILFPFKIDSQSKNVPLSPKKKNDEEWNPSEAFKKIHKDRKSESPNKNEKLTETKYYQPKPKEGEGSTKYYQSKAKKEHLSKETEETVKEEKSKPKPKKEHHPRPSKETEGSIKELPKEDQTKPKKEFRAKSKKSPSKQDETKSTTLIKIYQPVKE